MTPPRLLPDERRAAFAAIMIAVAIILLGICVSRGALARDLDGRWANSEHKEWFKGLTSKRGPCCDGSDGFRVDDVDWEVKDGKYRVRLKGKWHDVPAEALITEPNRVGKTMVWPIEYPDHIFIRCFMPGAMT